MSDLAFKNTFEMTVSELYTYIAELEIRVRNADSGARLFKDEANLARTECLKWKEIANQHDDRLVECHLDVEKHLEMLLAIMRVIPETATAWHEYDILLRMVMNFTANILRNFRETYLGEPPTIVDSTGYDDIPF